MDGAATLPGAVAGDVSLAPGTRLSPGSGRVPVEPRDSARGTHGHLVWRHRSPQRSLPKFHNLRPGSKGVSPARCQPPRSLLPWESRWAPSGDGRQPSRAGQGARGVWGYPPQGSSAPAAPRQRAGVRGCVRHGMSNTASPPASPKGRAQITLCIAKEGCGSRNRSGTEQEPYGGEGTVHPLGGAAVPGSASASASAKQAQRWLGTIRCSCRELINS